MEKLQLSAMLVRRFNVVWMGNRDLYAQYIVMFLCVDFIGSLNTKAFVGDRVPLYKGTNTTPH